MADLGQTYSRAIAKDSLEEKRREEKRIEYNKELIISNISSNEEIGENAMVLDKVENKEKEEQEEHHEENKEYRKMSMREFIERTKGKCTENTPEAPKKITSPKELTCYRIEDIKKIEEEEQEQETPELAIVPIVEDDVVEIKIEEKKEYGNEDINKMLGIFKQYHPLLKISDKKERYACKNLLQFLKKRQSEGIGKDPFDTVSGMLQVLQDNKFHSQKTASVVSFYANISQLFDIAKKDFVKKRQSVYF